MDPAIKKVAESPAFARAETDDNYGSEGIDVRTYIATKALAAIINAEYSATAPPRLSPQQAAEDAVIHADALIAELSKS